MAEALEGRRLLTTITETPIPFKGAVPVAIASGPGGLVWFADQGNDAIGSVDPATGAVREYRIPNASTPEGLPSVPGLPNYPNGIVAGPDGRVYFTEATADAIGAFDPASGTFASYAIPTASANPYGLAVGADGNIWFTEENASQVGELVLKSGTVREFPLPIKQSEPDSIVAGPDGNLWLTLFSADRIERLNPTTGTLTPYVLPTPAAMPIGITVGADGNLWFTESAAGQVGRLDPTSGTISEYRIPGTSATPWAIDAGPGGSLWFTEHDSAQVGTLNVDAPRSIALMSTPTAGSAPTAIAAVGPNTLWFAESGVARLGLVTITAGPGGPANPSATPSPPSTGVGAGSSPTQESPAPASTPASVPSIVSEQAIIRGVGRHARLAGFRLTFTSPVDARAARDPANFRAFALRRRGGGLVTRPLRIRAIHRLGSESVRLVLAGRPGLPLGGRIVIDPTPGASSALSTSATGPVPTTTLLVSPLDRAAGNP